MATAFLLAGITALAAAQHDSFQVGDGFIRFPVTGHNLNLAAHGASKRQQAMDLTKIFYGGAYTIQLQIGTPPQPVVVQLDTGSTELWVNANCAKANGGAQVSYCNTLPRYTEVKSTSYVDTGPQTTLLYGGGNATVEYVTDVVQAGKIKLKNQTFGLALDSHLMPFGILGMAPYLWGNHYYTFFIDNLKAQGFTKSRAFSLDLRSIDSNVGSIIFGGLDAGKYIGALAKIPIVPSGSSPDGEPRYWVPVQSVTFGTKTLSTGPITVLLDSGTTLSLLPAYLHDAIGRSIPTSRLDGGGSGYYIVDCNIANLAGSVDFHFPGKTIKVAYKDIIWTVASNVCVVGTRPTTSNFFILGDSVLRSAYVVFDLDQQNIHIAQAANCGTRLLAIGKGTNAVPSVTGACKAPSSTPKSTTPTTSVKKVAVDNVQKTLTTVVKYTTTYKVTSCPKTATKCVVGKVTTQVVTKPTTYCSKCTTTKKKRHVQLPATSARSNSPDSATAVPQAEV